MKLIWKTLAKETWKWVIFVIVVIVIVGGGGGGGDGFFNFILWIVI